MIKAYHYFVKNNTIIYTYEGPSYPRTLKRIRSLKYSNNNKGCTKVFFKTLKTIQPRQILVTVIINVLIPGHLLTGLIFELK